MEQEELDPVASVILKAVSVLAALATVGVLFEFVFSSPFEPRDSYRETLLVGLCYVWWAFAFVYHASVVWGDNMRILGCASIILAVLLAAGVFFFLPGKYEEQRIFWALFGIWGVFTVVSLVARKFPENPPVPPKEH